jgi:5'-methylthioadenosine phosphorylase
MFVWKARNFPHWRNLTPKHGFDVIGMTNLTEAKLAREAELCYATVAMITDYDCWHAAHSSVTVAQIIENLTRNAENARNVIHEVVKAMPDARECKCCAALAHAILTDRNVIPAAAKKRRLTRSKLRTAACRVH